jgi:hypothetical protein
MHSLLKLSLILSVLGVAGAALAQDQEPTFDDNACLWVNGNTFVCVSPKLVYDPGIEIWVDGEIINGRHLEASWWPVPLDWYEVQLSAECLIDNTNGTRFVTVVSQWGQAPQLNCPDKTVMVDNQELFKIRVRELE